MKLTASAVTAILAYTINFTSALPAEQLQSRAENLDSLYPAHLDCGPDGKGFPGADPPDYGNLRDAANDLSDKGGTCTTPPGSGKCIRVACYNTTGIWMCNTNGHDGPYSANCKDVAGFVYRGESDGTAAKDIWYQCRNAGLYAITSTPGQAYAPGEDWNVITGYANCNHSPLNPPDNAK